ncbi:MAG: helix-turn-helix transcriptional regulator [Henriciella sp.]|uniref:helix-turn-helix domain-containing protein n=1 Tax=Henriciella sp. TaxID=1968823 RepID=UPI003C7212B6
MSKKTSPITRLDYWRRANGLTTRELGRRLGVAQMTAWRYCAGKQHPQYRDTRCRLELVTDGVCDAANYADPVDPETGEAIEAAALSEIHRDSGDQSKKALAS